MKFNNRRKILKYLPMLGMGFTSGFALDKSGSPVTAKSFRNTGFRGFAIDRVSTRAGDEPYFDALLSTNANIARIFFPFKKCVSCTQFGRSPSDVTGLKKILDYIRPTGLKIVVVATFEDQDKPSFWTNEDLRSSFVANWRWFSETFRNDSAIAGLDLLNEPNPPGVLKNAQELWHPLAAQAIDAIRSTGVKLPIIFEGIGGGQAIGMRELKPFNDSEIVYSFHLYTPHDITHQKIGSAWPRSIPYPAGPEWRLKDAVVDVGGWNSSRLEEALKDVLSFQKQYNAPIFVGEFSCVRWAPNNSAKRYIDDSLNIFQKYGWSWCYHEFRGWPGWDAEIDSSDASSTQRSSNAPTMRRILDAINAQRN